MDRIRVNAETGLLEPCRYLPSPNCDERPDHTDIDMIVIHNISLPPAKFGTGAVEAFFTNTLEMAADPYYQTISHLKVSSHLFIKRTGEMIQFVPFTKRAFHAGESFFDGKTRCNDFSIGIELEGTDDLPYESIQYQQLVRVIQALIEAYPSISLSRIVGHSDIAPSRKTDPGSAFDWNYLKGMLHDIYRHSDCVGD